MNKPGEQLYRVIRQIQLLNADRMENGEDEFIIRKQEYNHLVEIASNLPI